MYSPHPRNSRLSALSFICLGLLAAGLHTGAYAQTSAPPAPKLAAETKRGIQLYDDGQTSKAIELLSARTREHPDDADAWYYLGLAAERDGAEYIAGPAFEHALQLRPALADAYGRLAYALLLANQPKLAAAAATRAQTLGINTARLHYVLARGRVCADDDADCRTQVLQELANAFQLEPNMPEALLLKSHLLASTDRAAAADYLAQYLALRPNDPDAGIWREQLEFLRPETAASPGDEQVYTQKEVTTRAVIRSKPTPDFTAAARKANVCGEVRLRLILGRDGTVRSVRVLRYLSHGLTQTAVDAARRIMFDPALKDGQPVSQYVVVSYNFNIY
jgi:TonB family protein